MNTLDRYIGISIAKGYLLVMLIFLGLFGFLDFVEQLKDIGKGYYRLPNALLYVIFTMPKRVVDLLPFIALLGSIFALGGLASRSELIAMQATGVSVRRVALSVIKTSVLIILALAILDQVAISPLHQFAQNQQSMAILGTGDLRTQKGFWSRDGQRFINVRNILHGRIPSDIDIYQFDEQDRLRVFTHADRAETFDFRHWLLIGVQQKVIDSEGIVTRQLGSMRWESFLTPEQIRILALPSETLSPLDLYHYVSYLRASGQSPDRYELALWQKASLPLATLAMVLLSVPFAFGQLRAVSIGKRLILGSMVGIAFYLVTQIVANVGLMLDLSAPITVMVPVILVLSIAVLLLRQRS